jgi:hypothetical protein
VIGSGPDPAYREESCVAAGGGVEDPASAAAFSESTLIRHSPPPTLTISPSWTSRVLTTRSNGEVISTLALSD